MWNVLFIWKIFGKVYYEIVGTFFIYNKFGIADNTNSAFFQFNTVVYKSYYVCEMDQNTFLCVCNLWLPEKEFFNDKEALIVASINPQYDQRLFMELPWTICCHFVGQLMQK